MNISVVGLGRVGLPLALVLADGGHNVLGIDRDNALLLKLQSKECPFYEPGLADLLRRHINGRIKLSDRVSDATKAGDTICITVGTHLSASRSPLLENLYQVADELASPDLRGKLIICKVTVPLGTTMSLKAYLEEKSGLACGSDFYLAFSPERIVEGKAIEETRRLPVIVGGVDQRSHRKAVDFYKATGGRVIEVENATAAELVKLIDNSYRCTIFAFANDIALVAERYGLDAGALIHAANDGYPRNNIPFPSCGVSGYCLTKDPLYLEASFADIAKERGFPSLWFSGRKTNDYMPLHTVDLTEEALRERDRTVRMAEVLVCGVTYKENIDDVRASHGIEIAGELERRGARVSVYDPWPPQEIDLGFRRYDEVGEAFAGKDAVIFTVKHRQFVEWKGARLRQLMSYMRTPVLIDGWNIFPEMAKDSRVTYRGIGNK